MPRLLLLRIVKNNAYPALIRSLRIQSGQKEQDLAATRGFRQSACVYKGVWPNMKYLIFTIILVLFFGCNQKESLMGCQEQIIFETLSLDRESLAILKNRDCGATTEVVQVIQIKEMKRNTISDIYILRGNAEINLIWMNNQLVVTSEAAEEDVFKKVEKQDGKNILYR